MITIIQSIILGIVQGITEWLPISSSGHLVITQHILHLDMPLIYDILLHIATLLVIFTIFRTQILDIVKAYLRFDFQSDAGKLGTYIIIGSIPTAIIGLLFKDLFTSFFSNLRAVAIGLLTTGIILYISKFNNNFKPITTGNSFLIGIVQGFSIIPGISRSGSTISTGLILGLDRKKVATFSFLLSVPAVIGATVLQIASVKTTNLPVIPTLAGFISAYIIGYIALKFLLRVIINNKFHYFSYYCWVVGIIVLSQSF